MGSGLRSGMPPLRQCRVPNAGHMRSRSSAVGCCSVGGFARFNMKSFTRNFAAAASFAALIALSTAMLIQPLRAAGAEDGTAETPPMMNPAMRGHDQMPGMMQHHQQSMAGMQGQP